MHRLTDCHSQYQGDCEDDNDITDVATVVSALNAPRGHANTLGEACDAVDEVLVGHRLELLQEADQAFVGAHNKRLALDDGIAGPKNPRTFVANVPDEGGMDRSGK